MNPTISLAISLGTVYVGAAAFVVLAVLVGARALARAAGRSGDQLARRLLLPIVPLVPCCVFLAIGNLLSQP